MSQERKSGLPAIEQSIIISSPIEKVWNLSTTEEEIGKWFMPSDIKPELGHIFHMDTPFGRTPCEVIEVNAPHLLKFTWDTDGWVVSFILEKIGNNKTKFTVKHDGWLSGDEFMPKAKQPAKDVYENMHGGWAGIVRKLKKVVEG